MTTKQIADKIFQLFSGGFTPKQISDGMLNARVWKQAHLENEQNRQNDLKKTNLANQPSLPELVGISIDLPTVPQVPKNSVTSTTDGSSLVGKIANFAITTGLGASMENLAKKMQERKTTEYNVQGGKKL